MNVIDLFSGVGGFSTGLHNAGFRTILANEIDKQIAESYQNNHPDTLMINEDINDFVTNIDKYIEASIDKISTKNKHIIKNKLSKINLVVGGPPCQGFSMAGGRIRKQEKFIDDPRNYLFKRYFEVIQKFEPKYFILENVIGITSMNNGEILEQILELFSNENNFQNGKYYLSYKIFKMEEYGVPQRRRRFILIGSKKDFNLDDMIKYTFENLPQDKIKLFQSNHSVYDAISEIFINNDSDYSEKIEYFNKPKNDLQKYLRNKSNYIVQHLVPSHSEETIDRIKRIKQGQNWKDLEECESIKSVHSGAYGRMIESEPSVTITTRFDTPSAGRFIHPYRHSNITIREAARIQTFPDTFVFKGNKTSICKQIGNAVPPLFAEFLGNLINNIDKVDIK
jgi:DNA (cytosine-5)-methyltransferase 1